MTISEQLRTLSFPNNNFIGEPWVVWGVWGQWAALCHKPVRSDIHWKTVPSGPVHSGAEFIQIVHNSQGLEISWQLTHCRFRIYVVGWGLDMVVCTLGKVFWSDLAWQTLIRSQHKILVLFENFRTDLLTCNTPWPQVQEPRFWPFFFCEHGTSEPLSSACVRASKLVIDGCPVGWQWNFLQLTSCLAFQNSVSATPKFVSFICRCKVQSKDVNIHHVKGKLKVKFYLARTFEAWFMDPTCWNLWNYFTTHFGVIHMC